MAKAIRPLALSAAHRPAPMRLNAPTPSFLDCYLPVTQRLLEMREAQPQGLIVGFTSVAPGEGVTHVVASLARKLAEHSWEQILLTTSADLGHAASAKFDDSLQLQQLIRSGYLPPVRTPRREDLQALRQRFGFVLVDCPAMRVSASLATLSSLCDTAVLVVAAGEARRSEIEIALKILKTSSVKLLGMILNKQVDPVPSFLSRFL